MATAEELLGNELSGVNNLYFEVDLLARKIVIPGNITNLGARGDEDVMHARFKLPRFYYDIDFADFKIGIDYTNAKGEEDRYEPKDVVIANDVVTFTWVVGRHAALYEGAVTFGLCAKRLNPDDPDNPLNEFHTTKASLPILDSMETCEESIVMHTDLLEQWRQELFGIGDTEEAAIRAAGSEVLASIPEDYQTTARAFRSKADAIVRSAQGETIHVSDSSDDPIRGLKIFGKTTQVATTGKNLFNPAECIIAYGDNTINGDVITTAFVNSTIYIKNRKIYPKGTYTISIVPVTDHAIFHLYFYSPSSGASLKTIYQFGRASLTATVDIDEDFTISIGGAEAQYRGTYSYKLQLESGTTATAYEPYSGRVPSPNPEYPQELVSVENPVVNIYGKNLASNRINNTVTHKGITIMRKAGSSEVVLNGTATEQFSYKVLDERTLPAGTYTISVYDLNRHNDSTDRLYIYDTINSAGIIDYVQTGSPKTFELKAPTTFRVDAIFTADSSYVNQVVQIQIESGNSVTTYEPGKTIQTVSSSRSIHGIPVESGGNYTDCNGQQWVCDEIDFERGVYVQRVYHGNLPSGSWHREQVTDTYREYAMYTSSNIFVNGFARSSHFGKSDINRLTIGDNKNIYVRFPVSAGIDTIDDVVKFFNDNDVVMSAQLLTHIETPLTAEELAAFQVANTNFPNTVVFNDAGAMMELTYNADTKTYLNNCFRPTDEQVQVAVDSYLDENPVEPPVDMIYLTDRTTGAKYELYVDNGKLTMRLK